MKGTEITAINTDDYNIPGIGPVKLHAVVPRFLEAIAKWDPTSLFCMLYPVVLIYNSPFPRMDLGVRRRKRKELQKRMTR
ncbi:MAG: hypothetical protein IKC53_04535, partial [Lentisphaeria bacterium]|nr:hypothetical protein [Lentisphaeria bacterium]